MRRTGPVSVGRRGGREEFALRWDRRPDRDETFDAIIGATGNPLSAEAQTRVWQVGQRGPRRTSWSRPVLPLPASAHWGESTIHER